MVIVDTSVWIDHFRSRDDDLSQLLDEGQVLAHSWVIGELILSGLSTTAGRLLDGLPQAAVARDHELMRSIRSNALANTGIGLVDAQLVTSTLLTTDATLWTRERRLIAVAERLDIAHSRVSEF
jgi:predicted nucleic acid-binding protein